MEHTKTKKFKKTKIMKCPKCKRKLVISSYSRYQNLIEHVSNPNSRPTIKPEYKCLRIFINCYPKRIFWDEFGDAYIPPSIIQRMLWKLNIYGIAGRLKVPEAIKDS